MMSHRSTSRVALLLWTTQEVPRQSILGVRAYAHETGGWELVLRGTNSPTMEELAQFDGVIGFFPDPTPLAKGLAAAKIPAINISGAGHGHTLTQVLPDDRAAGRMAAEHLIERGVRRLLAGSLNTGYGQRRLEGFIAAGQHAGIPAESRPTADLQQWLSTAADTSLPVGVYAPNDGIGLNLIRTCLQMGRRVPDDAAVVGTDNTVLLCEMSVVPMSSVDLNARQIGYEAAAQLRNWMIDGIEPPLVTWVAPKGIAARASTDLLPGADHVIAEAVRFLRQHACSGINVSQAVDRLGVSRRVLERGVREVLGRSPLEELNRVRINRARELLRTTDWTVAAIAQRTGFATSKNFSRRFRAIVAMTPAEWRRKMNRQ